MWEAPVREVRRYARAMQVKERADLEFRYWQTRMLVKAFSGADLPELPAAGSREDDGDTTMTERLVEQYGQAGLLKEKETETTPPAPSGVPASRVD